jgi:cellulose synthase/poly-beta-1,6-N-acetylglucosamine synthase-like glycosyltransferase
MEIILILYYLAAVLLTAYGVNCHVMVYLFRRRLASRTHEDIRLVEHFYQTHGPDELPFITTQLPIYNEMNVAERVIDAVAQFDYPSGKHEIQVLDDSTDETREIVARKVAEWRARGVQIELITRSNREGFKAGALLNGMHRARGEFMAIFDADFLPPPDFLLRSVPFFLMDPTLGLVQGRWGHLNDRENLLTRLQSIGIDGHFIVEQSARNWNDLFMNFNGTAGIFRKQAILDAGSWEYDTLTEDLDLSYRMQLAGWKCRYLIDLLVPAEIPQNINALKMQQFRWAKGSIQTAIKILPKVLRSDFSGFRRLQAVLHLTHYLVHPLMVYLALAAVPMLMRPTPSLSPLGLAAFAFIVCLSASGPSRMYFVAEKYAFGSYTKRVMLLPLLVCFGCGLAINNARAVWEALRGVKSEFIRTPKHGTIQKKVYRAAVNSTSIFELLAGFWCLSGVFFYFDAGKYLVGHFLLIYALGFSSIGLLSIIHHR